MKLKAKQYAQALFLEIKDAEKKEIISIVDRFTLILKEDNCFSQLEKIILHFKNLFDKEYSLIEGDLVLANELSSLLKNEIINYLKKISKSENLSINEKQDKGIKGGFVIKYGDKIIDASIKTKLNKFKNNLIQ